MRPPSVTGPLMLLSYDGGRNDLIRTTVCCTSAKGRVSAWRLAPHLTHPRSDVDANAVPATTYPVICSRDGPARRLEQLQQRVGDEARAGGINVAVDIHALPMRKKALRDDEVQVVLGARHGHIQHPPVLRDLRRRAGAEVRGDAAVHDIQHEHRLPLLALG